MRRHLCWNFRLRAIKHIEFPLDHEHITVALMYTPSLFCVGKACLGFVYQVFPRKVQLSISDEVFPIVRIVYVYCLYVSKLIGNEWDYMSTLSVLHCISGYTCMQVGKGYLVKEICMY